MIKFTENDLYLVTGASSGIGKAIALRINELGGKVLAVARREEKLIEMRKLALHPDLIIPIVKDLSANLDELPLWLRNLTIEFGKFKGLILSAGVQQTVPLKTISITKAKELFEVNYFANLSLCKGFCDKRVYSESKSSIVLISSIAAIKGSPGLINYSAAKGAIDSLVKSMALEVAKYGIRVNAIAPGFVLTEMIENWQGENTGEYLEKMTKGYPLGLGRVDDIADLTCFLLSGSSRWITGQSIVIDGGASI
ncbi:SDR family oxidoreductase [Paenibacillus psychroresistens]|uniref:SDR family oxidoreductase n=1 Tax=Paenibacillus psychroresistens TaxID=1778678 RepID=A0A6B8RQ33_9BACL|nr:SDR family oxidoreductase [Paenibacillus psychroresistens]QGQ98480.1 SDR family oxidoreductase [Paenibacillus psychroresistens]